MWNLLQRLGRPLGISLDCLEMLRQERGWLRKAARIKAGQKKQKTKPLAPVEETLSNRFTAYSKKKSRLWKWLGETNGFIHGELYTSEEIRSRGFKLPKLQKKGRKQ